jgi:AcrR family transcriptional regulator
MADVKHFDADAVLEDVVSLVWRQGISATGVQNVVAATGVSRSSLYATFGSKNGLCAAALQRYIEQYSVPTFGRLAATGSGLPAIEEFFAGLIRQRCEGRRSGWGCMVTNAHAGPESADPAIRALLDLHQQLLRDAMRSALAVAAGDGRLRPGLDLGATATALALLAYGVNLRSRAGANAESLRRAVAATIDPLRA